MDHYGSLILTNIQMDYQNWLKLNLSTLEIGQTLNLNNFEGLKFMKITNWFTNFAKIAHLTIFKGIFNLLFIIVSNSNSELKGELFGIVAAPSWCHILKSCVGRWHLFFEIISQNLFWNWLLFVQNWQHYPILNWILVKIWFSKHYSREF